jgi:hypothetical protein
MRVVATKLERVELLDIDPSCSGSRLKRAGPAFYAFPAHIKCKSQAARTRAICN